MAEDKLIKKQFGKNLKYYRKIRALTQAELAEKLGLDISFVAKVESGISFVSAENIGKICRSLNIRPYDLFKEENVELEKMTKVEKLNYILKEIKSLEDNKLDFMCNIIENLNRL